MNVEQLKNSILQLAIQGKLVEQREEEGTAEELYQQIQYEKNQLIKEGKLKKSKPLPHINQEEIHFEIPDNWKWTTLEDISLRITSGGTPSRSNPKFWNNGEIPWLKIKDIKNKYIEKVDEYITEEGLKSSSAKIFPKGTILYTIFATIGDCGILNFDSTTNQAIAGITLVDDLLSKDYIYYVLIAEKQIMTSKSRGMAQLNINQEILKNLYIPLPPLTEQQRIVDKIEELMPLIEEYGESYVKLEELNKSFPQYIKQSILQYAIQGKLVEQREEEGTAEELYQQIQLEKNQLIKEGKVKKSKPLPPIDLDEVPFEIPASWNWVSLGTLVEIMTGKKDANFGSDNGEFNFFTCAKEPIRSSTYSYDGEYIILPGNGANVGQSLHYIGKFEAYQRTYLLKKVFNDTNFKFIKVVLDFMWKAYNQDRMYGSATPYIKLANLTDFILPIPPISEQQRIVDKVEELTNMIDRMIQ